MKTKYVVTSAILGVLAGAACGGTQAPAASPQTAEGGGSKDGCGNHAPGACSAAKTNAAPAKGNDSAGPLVIARTETVHPGEHVEINLTFDDATPAKAQFKASSSIAWNVHSHAHDEVTIHQKGNGVTGEITFQPPAPGTYSFLWKNEGTAPVTLDVNVSASQGVSERHR